MKAGLPGGAALLLLLLPLGGAQAFVGSSPELGKAEGRCRPGESGPALLVDVR